MSRGQLAGKWQQVKGFAQQQWSRVTGNRIGAAAGLRQRSLGKIRVVDALAQQAHEQQLAEWRERQHKADPIYK